MPTIPVTNGPLPGQPVGPSHLVVAFTLSHGGGNGFVPHGTVLAVDTNPAAHDRYAVWTAYTRNDGLTWEVEQGDYCRDLRSAFDTYSARGGEVNR